MPLVGGKNREPSKRPNARSGELNLEKMTSFRFGNFSIVAFLARNDVNDMGLFLNQGLYTRCIKMSGEGEICSDLLLESFCDVAWSENPRHNDLTF